MNFERNCHNVDAMAAGDMSKVEPMASQNLNMQMSMGSCPVTPIYECPEERVCHRYICYEVPHIKPCNTRIINHHVYRHTFTPCFTCCEENVVENVFDRHCC